MTTSDDNRWHVDKKVPLALIFAMIVQFAIAMVFIVTVKNQGDENTRRIATLESQRIGERIAGLEAQVAATNALLLRVDAATQRLIERTPGR